MQLFFNSFVRRTTFQRQLALFKAFCHGMNTIDHVACFCCMPCLATKARSAKIASFHIFSYPVSLKFVLVFRRAKNVVYKFFPSWPKHLYQVTLIVVGYHLKPCYEIHVMKFYRITEIPYQYDHRIPLVLSTVRRPLRHHYIATSTSNPSLSNLPFHSIPPDTTITPSCCPQGMLKRICQLS
jgi:hypothetical protein